MDRPTFARNFLDAAVAARGGARQLLLEHLPDAMLFRLRLNQSVDRPPLRPGEVVYPHDRQPGFDMTGEEAVDLLWRAGSVPEWIDVGVIDISADATVLELEVCGRFASTEELLYHRPGGLPPFHVLQVLPPGYRDGARFSIEALRRRPRSPR